jgi:chromosome segregation protein
MAARNQQQILEGECHARRARRDELAPRIDAVRAELDARREKRSEAEVALARAESDTAHQVAQCREELHAEPLALVAELPAEQVLSGEALTVAEEQLRELKMRLENLGPVNMMALEELQEAEDRYGFLETQRQDLLASIEDTAQAIKEIDQVSRQQFLEAFKAINVYFAESFRTLFGGGIGEMRLSDEADADSGIDVVAQPPGKRLQNVLLLSGGEKALAALALLIALFHYTPSPFCILDEVDAPLDESNVDRFTHLIQQMSRHTQFILITHNKRTMEIAEVLYGVTMEELGISRLVSVRFDEVASEPLGVPVPA